MEFKIGGKYYTFKDKISVRDYTSYQKELTPYKDRLFKLQFVYTEIQKLADVPDSEEKIEILSKQVDKDLELKMQDMAIMIIDMACPELNVKDLDMEDYNTLVTSEEYVKWLTQFIPQPT